LRVLYDVRSGDASIHQRPHGSMFSAMTAMPPGSERLLDEPDDSRCNSLAVEHRCCAVRYG
jgi:hypothetical protein